VLLVHCAVPLALVYIQNCNMWLQETRNIYIYLLYDMKCISTSWLRSVTDRWTDGQTLRQPMPRFTTLRERRQTVNMQSPLKC